MFQVRLYTVLFIHTHTGLSHLCIVNTDDQTMFLLGGKDVNDNWRDEVWRFTEAEGWTNLADTTGTRLDDVYNKPACLVIR